MKKTLTLMSALVLVLTCSVVLAACGGAACTHEGYHKDGTCAVCTHEGFHADGTCEVCTHEGYHADGTCDVCTHEGYHADGTCEECTHEGYMPIPESCLALEIEREYPESEWSSAKFDITMPVDENRIGVIMTVDIVSGYGGFERIGEFASVSLESGSMGGGSATVTYIMIDDVITTFLDPAYIGGGYGAYVQFVAIGKDGVANWYSDFYGYDQF